MTAINTQRMPVRELEWKRFMQFHVINGKGKHRLSRNLSMLASPRGGGGGGWGGGGGGGRIFLSNLCFFMIAKKK